MFKKFLLTSALPVVAALCFASSAASAAPLFTASFESPVLDPNGVQYGPDAVGLNSNASGPVVIPNFTFGGTSGIIHNGAAGAFPSTSFGVQAAFLQSYQGSGSSIIWAIMGLTAGQTYSLSFYDVAANTGIALPENFTVSAFGSAPLLFLPTTSYALQSFNFVAGASNGSISFVGPAIPGTGNFATAIDNIQISALAVPEPFTLSIFGAGLVGAAAMRRRAKKT